MKSLPQLADIRVAALRIQPHLQRTPVLQNATIDRLCKAQVLFKCENFQKVGAFKARGALNVVLALKDSLLENGVATHSSGNHAAALALAAGIRGIPAYIVMPENTPSVKKRAVESYGARITYCPSTLKDREETLAAVIRDTGACLVHPFNDYGIIAGQATAALELLEEAGDLDIIMAPVGGGGLISGTALVTRYLAPATQVIGAEPSGADDAQRSFRSGELQSCVNPHSIADGLLTSLGDLTFAIIKGHVQDIVTVDDSAIIAATRLIMERMKILVEPSAAVPLAAILAQKIDVSDRRVGIILSGGNIDLDNFMARTGSGL